MEDVLIMSKKELQRKTLLDAFQLGKLTLVEVAQKLKLTYRQTKRIWRRYKDMSDAGLIHKSRGKPSSHAHSQVFHDRIIDLYREKYLEFGPTYAAEKLEEDDLIKINPETLRLWLKHKNLWTSKRKRKVHRERRERRPHFGDLLQIDGSIHDWFGDGVKHCLLNIVDDATGICFALLDKGETTQILLQTFKRWIEKYGIPKAVYVDLKSVYVSPKRMKEKYDDDLLIAEGFSVFEVVCKELNIDIIKAYSAQAKGRVERKHGVFQDRLVKDFKLYGISNLDAGNIYLENAFLSKINNKFAKAPAGGDSHRAINSYENIDEIICTKYHRKVKNDWTIQFKRQYYQLSKDAPVKPNDEIIFKKYLDGSMKCWHQEVEIKYYLLERKPIPPSTTKEYYVRKGPEDPILRSKRATKNRSKTSFNSFNPSYLSSVKAI